MLPAELGDAGRAGTNWTRPAGSMMRGELVLCFKRLAMFTSKTGSPITALYTFGIQFTIHCSGQSGKSFEDYKWVRSGAVLGIDN